MKKAKFIKFFAAIILIGAFVTIYQHNQIIKIMYEKRRLEIRKEQLAKEKIELQVRLCALHDYTQTRSHASHQLGMTPLKLSQVITVTQQVYELDFYHASSHDVLRCIEALHQTSTRA
ncbi:cell division protein FtsL [Candidatus Dependentiae bacterium]|jgi:cell division protein FtsL|nr:cell division protein FtsL [Candidatus Dependentiae bacterium]